MKKFICSLKEFWEESDETEKLFFTIIICFLLFIFCIFLPIITSSRTESKIEETQVTNQTEVPVVETTDPLNQSITINTNPMPTVKELETNSSFGFKQEINVNGANSTVTVNNYKNKE